MQRKQKQLRQAIYSGGADARMRLLAVDFTSD